MSVSLQTRIEKIRQKIQGALSPEKLEIIDESAKHHGHAGAQAGAGYYIVEITASAFKGKALIECHQMIYKAVGDMMPQEIHALRIKTHIPDGK